MPTASLYNCASLVYTTIYVSAWYYYICVLILLVQPVHAQGEVFRHTHTHTHTHTQCARHSVCVLILLYVSSYYCMLLYVSACYCRSASIFGNCVINVQYAICVLIPLYTTIYVSSYHCILLYMCPHTILHYHICVLIPLHITIM